MFLILCNNPTVKVEAQTVGDNSIKFNVQDDVDLNFWDGTSRVNQEHLFCSSINTF